MAPTTSTSIDGLNNLAARTYYCNGRYYSGYGNCNRSAWYSWGRWLFAGIVIVFIVGALLMLSCVHSRRRRKQGLPPPYGTGWMAPAPKYDNNNNYMAPPPQYNATPMQNYPTNNQQQPQYTGQTFNSNEGYYGGQTEGIAPPPNAYYPQQQRGIGGENVYEPPAGPPPGKH